MPTVTVSSKGQIVIPLRLRKEMGLKEGERLEVGAKDGVLVLTRAGERPSRRGWRAWAGALAGTGALAEHRREHRKEAGR